MSEFKSFIFNLYLYGMSTLSFGLMPLYLLRKVFFTIIFCVGMLCTYSQTPKTDSLLQIVKNSKNTGKRFDALIALTKQGEIDRNAELNYAKQAYELARQTEDDKGKLKALIRESEIYYAASDLKNAMESLLEAKSLAEKLDMQSELAFVLDGIGMFYYELGDKKKCADFYFSSLKLYEKLNDKEGMGKAYSRIGVLYNDLKDYTKAAEYYMKSLEMAKAIGYQAGIATNLHNLGNFYSAKHDYKKALDYMNQALAISRKTGIKFMEGSHYLSIGRIYKELTDNSSAMQYYIKALKIFEQLGIHTKIALCNLRISEVLLDEKKLDESLEHAKTAYAIGQAQGLKEIIYDAAKQEHGIYLAKKDTLTAYRYTIIENQWKDSLDLGEKEKNLTKMELQYHFEKKEQQEKADHMRKTMLNTAIILFLALSIVIILLILNQLRLKAKKSKLEKDGLIKELDFKKKELTLNVMSLMKKNEIFSTISEKLMGIAKEANSAETKSAIKKIGKEIQKGQEDEIWKEFTVRFKEVHNDFYNSLLTKYPNLTPSEQKLCAFLRLNMTTKEISELTGQSISTIEIARHRLRQKLGITSSDINLITFLSQI
jgi:tetratricopeptide (TPR) repeat protein